MLQIDYKKLIYELSDESFNELKEYVGAYFPLYFVDDSEMTKPMILEKLGDYLRGFQNAKNWKDSQLPKKYCELLLKYLNYRFNDKKDDESFPQQLFLKAEKIKGRIDAIEDEDELLINLMDFSKIFLVLYNSFMNKKKGKKSKSELSFTVRNISFNDLTDFFSEDKPEINPAINQIADMAAGLLNKLVPEKAANVAEDVIEKIEKIRIPFMEKTKEEINEPIYYYVDLMKSNNHYNEKTFATILLAIMYIANKEYEVSLGDQ